MTNYSGDITIYDVFPSTGAIAHPVNVIAPAISGTPRPGQTLTASTGTWANDQQPDDAYRYTGDTPPRYSLAYAYQWYRDGNAITGANTNSYLLLETDAQTTIMVVVTVTNVIASVSATSVGLLIESSLLNSLISYWQLEEPSGTRADIYGTNHLTPTNAPGVLAGHIGNAVSLVGSSLQTLSRANNASLQTGDIDWMVWCWFYTSSIAGFRILAAKSLTVVNREYELALNGANVQFIIYDGGLNNLGSRSVAFTPNQWNLAVAWRDKTANTINLKVNNGATSTATLSGIPAAATAGFYLGSTGGGANFLTGTIDEVGFRKAIPTTFELSELWNAGAGLTYPFDGSGPVTPGGSTIYVDPALAQAYTSTYSIANHNNAGTDGVGYQLLVDAIVALDAGGTLNLRGGTHSAISTIAAGQECCFVINKALTMQAYNGEAAIVTYPAGDPPIYNTNNYGPILYATVSNWTLDGLTIIGTRDQGDSAGGQDVDVSVLFGAVIGTVTIRRCTFQKGGHCGIKFGATNGPITIERNRFSANGFTQRDHHIYSSQGSASDRTVIRFNEFTGAAGYGIHLYDRDPVNFDIYGNVIHHNGGSYAPIVGGGGILLGGTGHRVYNNTIESNQEYGGIVFWKQGASDTTIVKNNIVRDNTMDIRMDASGGVATVGHNNKHTISIDGIGTGYNDGGTDVDINPLFTGGSPATWTDYRLQGGSPMIAAGEAQSSPYNQALDPAQTTTPTAKAQANPPTIGGFTT